MQLRFNEKLAWLTSSMPPALFTLSTRFLTLSSRFTICSFSSSIFSISTFKSAVVCCVVIKWSQFLCVSLKSPMSASYCPLRSATAGSDRNSGPILFVYLFIISIDCSQHSLFSQIFLKIWQVFLTTEQFKGRN